MSKGKTACRVYFVNNSGEESIDCRLIYLTDLKNTILPDSRESFFRRNVRLTDELKPGQKVDMRIIDEEAAKNRGYVITYKILEVYRMIQTDFDIMLDITSKSNNAHFQSCQVVKDSYEGRLKELHEKIKQLEQERDYQVKRVSPPLTIHEWLQIYVNEHGKAAQEGKPGKKKK